MSLRTNSFGAVLVFCLCATAWGNLHVQGEIFGTWSAGDSVFVDGPTMVPSGKGLVVEPGVVIVPKTTDPIIIGGSLDASGTPEHPILIHPVEGWNGFSFRPNTEDIQVLRYVIIPADSPEPFRVIVSNGARVHLDHCDFHSSSSCLDFSGGYMQALWNLLRSTGLYCKTVRIEGLANDITPVCSDNPAANRFSDNIVKADVPNSPYPDPFENFTSAFYVDRSTTLCVRRNTFSVMAPGPVIGTYFGLVDAAGSQYTYLDSCDVTAVSFSDVAQGVYNAWSGSLRILHCNVDVAILDDETPYRAAGVLASQSADVLINSSTVVLDRDTNFFVSLSGALLNVDYVTRWSSNTHTMITPPPGGRLARALVEQHAGGSDDPICNVEWGEHCYFADPRFLRNGNWGEWRSFGEVAAYYGVDSLSPCIDAGDAQWGYDPDNTLPDIGRYFYAQYSDAQDRDYPGVTSVALAPAYPNPFNSSTTIPFALQRSGNVRMVAFDMLGRQVWVVTPGMLAPGPHQILLNGDGFASGLYIVQVEVEGAPVARQRLVFLK